jgi:predicted metal-binding protein
MKPSKFAPTAQMFVCTHARAPTDPLKSGCGAAGPPLFDALRALAAQVGATRDLWVSRAGCLGHCPREGCAVAVYPSGGQWIEATVADARGLLLHALRANRGEGGTT